MNTENTPWELRDATDAPVPLDSDTSYWGILIGGGGVFLAIITSIVLAVL